MKRGRLSDRAEVRTSGPPCRASASLARPDNMVGEGLGGWKELRACAAQTPTVSKRWQRLCGLARLGQLLHNVHWIADRSCRVFNADAHTVGYSCTSCCRAPPIALLHCSQRIKPHQYIMGRRAAKQAKGKRAAKVAAGEAPPAPASDYVQPADPPRAVMAVHPTGAAVAVAVGPELRVYDARCA